MVNLIFKFQILRYGHQLVSECIISWALKSKENEHLFYVMDLANAFERVFICLIFINKKRVLLLLKQKLCSQIEIWKTSLTKTTSMTKLSTLYFIGLAPKMMKQVT